MPRRVLFFPYWKQIKGHARVLGRHLLWFNYTEPGTMGFLLKKYIAYRKAFTYWQRYLMKCDWSSSLSFKRTFASFSNSDFFLYQLSGESCLRNRVYWVELYLPAPSCQTHATKVLAPDISAKDSSEDRKVLCRAHGCEDATNPTWLAAYC